MNITYQKFIIGIFVIVIIAFTINLYQKNTSKLEHFSNSLNKLKAKSKNNKNKKKKNSDSGKGKSDAFADLMNSSDIKNKKKLTFEDLVKDAEDIDHEKYTVSKLKASLFDYIDSFNNSKAKFKNVSGTTTESLENFGYFKEKFYEIFA
jgi:hypothetical protein